MKLSKRNQLKYKICVSGAMDTGHCAVDAPQKAEELGREIASRGMVLITSATVGIPYWAAKGAKEEGGIVIGLSPASSEAEHVKILKLPTDYHDLIIYTGFGFSGRNLLMNRSADALINVCGRMGTLNEFTIAFEDGKPIGVLEGTGGTADELKGIVSKMHRGPGRVVYAKDIKELMDKVVIEIENDRKNPDGK